MILIEMLSTLGEYDEQALLQQISSFMPSTLADEIVEDLGVDLEWNDDLELSDLMRPLEDCRFPSDNLSPIQDVLIDEVLFASGIESHTRPRCLYYAVYHVSIALKLNTAFLPQESMLVIVRESMRCPFGLQVELIKLLLHVYDHITSVRGKRVSEPCEPETVLLAIQLMWMVVGCRFMIEGSEKLASSTDSLHTKSTPTRKPYSPESEQQWQGLVRDLLGNGGAGSDAALRCIGLIWGGCP